MISFLCKFRPRSVNAKSTQRYKEMIIKAYRYYYSENENKIQTELYGIAYYFHRPKTNLDADNFSKPIWDSLNDIIYIDDRQIKLRYAGIIDMESQANETVIDLKAVPENVYIDLLNSINNEDHIIYIEIGKLENKHFLIGVE